MNQDRETIVRHFYTNKTKKKQFGIIIVLFGRTYWFGRFTFHRNIQNQREEGEAE